MKNMSIDNFLERLDNELLNHSVITNNKYCNWFRQAELSLTDVFYFTQQFSVFSNQFIIAQLNKVINSVDLAEARAGKEVLANELGVSFKDGSVENGTYRFTAAHFEWLVKFAEPLGLSFNDIGKRRHGSPSTLFYCDELIRIYGNEDFNVSAGASFAVENWAAAGFWKDLIEGLENFRTNNNLKLPLSFFTWHDKLEDQHAEHTREEMITLYNEHNLNEDEFINAGNEMLNGVEAFWIGLDQERITRTHYGH
jgi:hypothetical protein